jgi:radical SAM/Cys-rich protein
MEPAKATLAALSGLVDRPFVRRLAEAQGTPIIAGRPDLLQLNLGYRCVLECKHCHLEAGPGRTEEMSEEVIAAALAFAERAGITGFDLTGGAPELNPHFRSLVEEIRARGGSVIDRCNLAILSEPDQKDLAAFLAKNRVKVSASLPHYRPEMTERVRGQGVFGRLIEGLRRLNDVGYGGPDTGLELTLVHTPAGAILPAGQAALEADFRAELDRRYGVVFNSLIVITNVPVGRFLGFLERTGNTQSYLQRLEQSFNPGTLAGLMCRTLLSVAWDGTVYDCDFNQALGLPIAVEGSPQIGDLDAERLTGRIVRCGSHCYACTAGQGSSCSGALAE